MRHIVTTENIGSLISSLLSAEVVSFDTETYGLTYDDKAFSWQFTILNGDSYYLNLKDYEDQPRFPIEEYINLFEPVFNREDLVWVIANAKFDMHRLRVSGQFLAGKPWDTLLVERILFNRHMKYSLDASLNRIGMAKNDQVKKWLDDNHGYTKVHYVGKSTPDKLYHYDRVPFDLMYQYGLDDTEDNLRLYLNQVERLDSRKDQIKLVESNQDLTQAVFRMEEEGIAINPTYVAEQAQHWTDEALRYGKEISDLLGKPFVSGPIWLEETLKEQGVELDYSDKGNPILDKNSLAKCDNAIASNIILMRDADKRASQYMNIQRFVASDGKIHPNYRMGGTDTFRFSCSDPNLQNVEACEKGMLNTVRTSFVPNLDEYLLSVDYRAMEYRLVADIAGEMGWIDAILGGTDPHQWVADTMGTGRKEAKTLNFMLLYGGGISKLAHTLLPCTLPHKAIQAICNVLYYDFIKDKKAEELLIVSQLSKDDIDYHMEMLRRADQLKKIYTQALPKVQYLIKQVKQVAMSRGYVTNQFGMRYYLDNPAYAYRMPNHLIQGTGGCTIRHAMVELDKLLLKLRSNMKLQIHDELIFGIHKDELEIVPQILQLMESAYKPMNGMILECDAAISAESWNENTFVPFDKVHELGRIWI